jgi:hypothetical protein
VALFGIGTRDAQPSLSITGSRLRAEPPVMDRRRSARESEQNLATRGFVRRGWGGWAVRRRMRVHCRFPAR